MAGSAGHCPHFSGSRRPYSTRSSMARRWPGLTPAICGSHPPMIRPSGTCDQRKPSRRSRAGPARRGDRAPVCRTRLPVHRAQTRPRRHDRPARRSPRQPLDATRPGHRLTFRSRPHPPIPLYDHTARSTEPKRAGRECLSPALLGARKRLTDHVDRAGLRTELGGLAARHPRDTLLVDLPWVGSLGRDNSTIMSNGGA